MKKIAEKVRKFMKENPVVVASIATSAIAIGATLLYYRGGEVLVIGRDGLQFLSDNPNGAIDFIVRGRPLVLLNAELLKPL